MRAVDSIGDELESVKVMLTQRNREKLQRFFVIGHG